MAKVSLKDVAKIFDDTKGTETAVENATLTVNDGNMVVLVGPSGCGKSTTLRMIAGLESISEGGIKIAGESVNGSSPSERDIAMVFQDYALYPKMSVRENLGYGLKHSTDLSKDEQQEAIEETAALLGIADLLEQQPAQLSGGQKQRVALGRAIIRKPNVFLMDEPLSNLDAKLRARMRTELQRIQEEVGVTTIYVTHDQTEAMTMGDTIVVMNDGQLEQVSSPEHAYNHPNNEFVASFLGSPSMNVLDVNLQRTANSTELMYAESPIVRIDSSVNFDKANGDTIRLGMRPEHLRIRRPEDDFLSFDSYITVIEYQGNEMYVYLDFDGKELLARTSPDVDLNEGEYVSVSISPRDVYVFDPDSGESLKTREVE